MICTTRIVTFLRFQILPHTNTIVFLKIREILKTFDSYIISEEFKNFLRCGVLYFCGKVKNLAPFVSCAFNF